MDDAKLLAVGVLWLLSLVVVGFAGYMMRDSLSQPEDVSYAPEVIQGDGSVVLERDPEPASEPAPHTIPSGYVEERRISIQVKPDVSKNAGKTDNSGKLSTDDKSPNISIDLSLIRSGTGRRVVASSEGGQIIGGIDVPIIPQDVPRRFLWAAGASYDPFKDSPGLWVERDLGRFRVGLDAYQDRYGSDTGMAARLRVGWVF